MKHLGSWLVVGLAAVIGCSKSNPASGGGEPAALTVDDLMALARVQDPASAGQMANALRTGPSAAREVAAFGLGQLGLAWEPPPNSVRLDAEKALIAAFAGEHDAAVRDRIIEALGKVGGAATVPVLEPIVKDAAGAAT